MFVLLARRHTSSLFRPFWNPTPCSWYFNMAWLQFVFTSYAVGVLAGRSSFPGTPLGPPRSMPFRFWWLGWRDGVKCNLLEQTWQKLWCNFFFDFMRGGWNKKLLRRAVYCAARRCPVAQSRLLLSLYHLCCSSVRFWLRPCAGPFGVVFLAWPLWLPLCGCA